MILFGTAASFTAYYFESETEDSSSIYYIDQTPELLTWLITCGSGIGGAITGAATTYFSNKCYSMIFNQLDKRSIKKNKKIIEELVCSDNDPIVNEIVQFWKHDLPHQKNNNENLSTAIPLQIS